MLRPFLFNSTFPVKGYEICWLAVGKSMLPSLLDAGLDYAILYSQRIMDMTYSRTVHKLKAVSIYPPALSPVLSVIMTLPHMGPILSDLTWE